jgi:hypothetical protein
MKKIFVVVAGLFLMFSCTKDKAETTCLDGFIFWGGDPAADGTGWYFSQNRFSQHVYFLQSLAADYKKDSLPVSACVVKTTNKFYCQCAGDPPYFYRITKINKR